MSIVERTQTFLVRLKQEEAAVRNARCTEARLAHQGIVVRLRRSLEAITPDPRLGR